MMEDDLTLKPCPFCGGEAYYRKPYKQSGTAFVAVSVECKSCGAAPYMIMVYEFATEAHKKAAIARCWNRRAAEKEDPAQ